MVLEDQVSLRVVLRPVRAELKVTASPQVSRRSTPSVEASVDGDTDGGGLGTDPEERLLQERDVEEGIAPQHEVWSDWL